MAAVTLLSRPAERSIPFRVVSRFERLAPSNLAQHSGVFVAWSGRSLINRGVSYSTLLTRMKCQ
jgi:hypothetical protein